MEIRQEALELAAKFEKEIKHNGCCYENVKIQSFTLAIVCANEIHDNYSLKFDPIKLYLKELIDQLEILIKEYKN